MKQSKTPSNIFIALALLIFSICLPVFGQDAAGRNELSEAFSRVVKKVGPAVVSIVVKPQPVEQAANTDKDNPLPGDLLDMLKRAQRRSLIIGSGFIVDKEGYIVTNAHVTESGGKIMVRLESGEEYPAREIGSDPETDISLIKIETRDPLPTVVLGDSSKARVGDWVLAIGSPFGLSRSVTAGIISQIDRDTPSTTVFQRFIQTDAAINRGNSGGPLVNLAGEVIGVNSQIATTNGDYNGVSFALPSNDAKIVVEQLKKYGSVRRGYLGVTLDTAGPEFVAIYGLGSKGGAIVTQVRDLDGPAAKAGISAGDVIVGFNGQPVSDAQDLISKVAAAAPGETVKLSVVRELGGKMSQLEFSLNVGERPLTKRAVYEPPARSPAAQKEDMLGLKIEDLTAAQKAALKISGEGGVVVKDISSDSILADAPSGRTTSQLLPGDIIQQVNRKSVKNVADFNKIALALKPGDMVVIQAATIDPDSGRKFLKFIQFTLR
ncbi:MAG TPA: trypsin-like peptidase domain-containing protein [Pyrinomonadaceae bacterium]|nr:trypsin-like peptidase domain-containing protein [Pyrinomonadaceae bacterium]